MSKKTIIPTITLISLLAVGMIGSRVAFAEEAGYSLPIVQKIAEAFGLNEDEVQAVFDAARDERRERQQINREERLTQAVTDGVITEEQKQALENKWQEMASEREAERAQQREKMRAWFESQGIDERALVQYGGLGHGGHNGMRMGGE